MSETKPGGKTPETSGRESGREFMVREPEENELIEMPIDGVLDLHTFRPEDVKELIKDYIEECLKRGVYDLRIIHGKGTGTLKAIVRSVLKKHPAVASFKDADLTGGGWGATEVVLKKDRQK